MQKINKGNCNWSQHKPIYSQVINECREELINVRWKIIFIWNAEYVNIIFHRGMNIIFHWGLTYPLFWLASNLPISKRKSRHSSSRCWEFSYPSTVYEIRRRYFCMYEWGVHLWKYSDLSVSHELDKPGLLLGDLRMWWKVDVLCPIPTSSYAMQ